MTWRDLSHAVRVRDMGREPPHWGRGGGRIPQQGDLQAHGEAKLVKKGWLMGIPLARGSNGGVGTAGDG